MSSTGLAGNVTRSRARVTVVGGKLRIDTLPGRWAALVRLPLTANYAHP